MKQVLEQVLEQVQVHAIPAFTDNYIWMMHDGSNAVVVDPGDAEPVVKALAEMGLSLNAIVLTHLHYDHCWACRDWSSAGRCRSMGRFSMTMTGRRTRHFQSPAPFLLIALPIRLARATTSSSVISAQT